MDTLDGVLLRGISGCLGTGLGMGMGAHSINHAEHTARRAVKLNRRINNDKSCESECANNAA